MTNAIGVPSNTHMLLYDAKGFVSIATADALALNQRQDLSCANVDLSSTLKYTDTHARIMSRAFYQHCHC